jgi:hypothetical protein
MLKNYLIVAAFLGGLYFCSTYKHSDVKEYFNLMNQCPNLLIRKGKEIHLVNTRKAEIPGINPIKFNNLEEYAEYVEWQKSVGIKCPVLYFQESYNTQNEKGLRLLNDPINPNNGMTSTPPPLNDAPEVLLTDSNRDDPPYNQNQYSGFDENNQTIGENTPLDNITTGNQFSPNPMANNWGGHKLTADAIKSGLYKDRTRDGTLDPTDKQNILRK